MKKQNRCGLLQNERGASLVELALLLPVFGLLLLVTVDFGRGCYMAIEIAGAARAGAIYGAQKPTDTAGMQTVAQDDAPDVPNVSVGTPTWSCECADGSGSITSTACLKATPSCSSGLNWVYKVNVTVTGTYSPLMRWPGIPSSMTFSSSASMRSPGGG